MFPSATFTLTSPATRPWVSVTMAAALSGPAARVKPVTKPVAEKARRVISLSMSFSLEAVFIAFGCPQRLRFIDAARDGARQAVGRDRPEPHRAERAAAGFPGCRDREDDVAIERRMHGSERTRETVRRHHRKPRELAAVEVRIGRDDGDGGVLSHARAFHVGRQVEIEGGVGLQPSPAELAVVLEEMRPEHIRAR